MKVYLDSIGCRLNQAEMEQYARQLHAAGHILVAEPQEADLALINTCTVTASADADSRQKIRQMSRAGVEQVIVTGCWSTLHPTEAAGLPNVYQVVPNPSKDRLVIDLLQLPKEVFEIEPLERQHIPGARMRTRAFVKVQDGCDNHCTFCITALARGASRSRPIDEILTEINGLLHATDENEHCATLEIVLTGVHLGCWGQDFSPGLHLRDLVQAILTTTTVPRLRLSSLEPWDLDADFFSLWQDPRLCRQLHLPLQSGCANTLKRMARKVTPGSYAELVQTARAVISDVAITTDVITGFPGENEAEFVESLDFIEKMNFADGHVFTYSERIGTAAARLPGTVPMTVRKVRNSQMRLVFERSSLVYRKMFQGQVLPVLWESTTTFGPDGWELNGLTDNYLRVTAHSPIRLWNQLSQVKITEINAKGVVGKLC
jgi:threonylcarbamoyladenosine tRNA methylthiotransferase MtaB